MTAPQVEPPEPVSFGSGARTSWGVRIASMTEPGEAYSGWLEVYADADARTVSFHPEDDDGPMEPAEARALAHALPTAADHAEHHHSTVMQVVSGIRDVLSNLMGDQPNEAKRAAHDAVELTSSDAYRRREAGAQRQRERATRTAEAVALVRDGEQVETTGGEQ